MRRASIGLIIGMILIGSACAVPVQKGGGAASGEEIYYAKCSFCHRPFPPGHMGPDAWADTLDEMGPRAGLSETERRKVLDFLKAKSD